MRAIVFDNPGKMSLVDIPEPVAGPDEILLQVDAAGLCGSDIHAFLGAFPAPFPYVPGHEVAGTAIAGGGNTDPRMIGKRFVVHPLRQCGHCDSCRVGRINFCSDLSIYGGNLQGGFAERVAVHQSCLYEVPENLSSEEAAFAEPLACVLHGLGQIGVEAGDRVLIVGAGSIGLLLLQAAISSGASRVSIADLVPAKLETARMLGGHANDLSVDTNKHAFDLVIDATGSPSIVGGLTRFARDGGRILFFGVCPPDATIPLAPFDIFRRELTIAGCFSLVREIGPALRLIGSGAVRVAPLISARQPLEGLEKALSFHDHGGTTSDIKTMMIPSLHP